MRRQCASAVRPEDVISSFRKKRREAKIVFVSGNFNIVHPGHLRLLRFAKECGSFLAVGVYSDALDRGVVLGEDHRLDGVKSISWVDFAFILREPPERFIRKVKPDIVVKGKEHETAVNPEQAAVDSYDGKLLFSSGDAAFSSIDLLHKELMTVPGGGFNLRAEFAGRHGFRLAELPDALGKMQRLKVLVIGELIVDEYVTCEALGMSREDPTIVVSPVVSDRFVGGAGIVAAHARGLGASVDFFSVTGADENAVYAGRELARYGVRTHLFQDDSRPTIHKQRYRAEGKTLLRVNRLRGHSINQTLTSKIFESLEPLAKKADLLVFSDFNYGLLHQGLADDITALCRKNGVMMVADSQSSSQTGDVSRFKHMCFLKPTEHEARLAVRDQTSGLVVLAEKLRRLSKSENVLMTLGGEGVLIHAKTSGKNKWLTDQLRPMNTAPRDVAGAGDSFLTCASMAMAAGCDIWRGAWLGSLAAACQVSRVGNIPLTADELTRELAGGR